MVLLHNGLFPRKAAQQQLSSHSGAVMSDDDDEIVMGLGRRSPTLPNSEGSEFSFLYKITHVTVQIADAIIRVPKISTGLHLHWITDLQLR